MTISVSDPLGEKPKPATIYILIDVGRKGRQINGLSVRECDWPCLGADQPRELPVDLGHASLTEGDVYL
jgi:hypothetical protein